MEQPAILYEVERSVATITLNRPDKYNAIDLPAIQDLTAALVRASRSPEVGVVVLTGAGDKAFCSGGDVQAEKDGMLERVLIEPYVVHQAITHCPKPVIARVNGYAIGAGNHIAYYCDFTIAAEHAIFGQNGPRVGSPASGAIVSYLVRVVGSKRAREMWMLARRYSAQQALDMGLVNAVVPAVELDAEVARWCDELLHMSPTCLAILKASFASEMSALLGETDQFQRLLCGPQFYESEQREGAQAFLEKRPPDYSKVAAQWFRQ